MRSANMDQERNATKELSTSAPEIQGKREGSGKGSFSPPCLPNVLGPSVSFLWVSQSVQRLCKIQNLPALLEDLEVSVQPGPKASTWCCSPCEFQPLPHRLKEAIRSATGAGRRSSPQTQVYIIIDLKTGMWNMISGRILTSTLYGLQCVTNVTEGKGPL